MHSAEVMLNGVLGGPGIEEVFRRRWHWEESHDAGLVLMKATHQGDYCAYMLHASFTRVTPLATGHGLHISTRMKRAHRKHGEAHGMAA